MYNLEHYPASNRFVNGGMGRKIKLIDFSQSSTQLTFSLHFHTQREENQGTFCGVKIKVYGSPRQPSIYIWILTQFWGGILWIYYIHLKRLKTGFSWYSDIIGNIENIRKRWTVDGFLLYKKATLSWHK